MRFRMFVWKAKSYSGNASLIRALTASACGKCETRVRALRSESRSDAVERHRCEPLRGNAVHDHPGGRSVGRKEFSLPDGEPATR